MRYFLAKKKYHTESHSLILNSRSQLRDLEFAKNQLATQLEEFRINRQGIKDMKEEKDQEIIMIGRLVKAEVIDIAVMMDEMTSVIDRQE